MAGQGLLSEHWYRVADTRPRLAANLRVENVSFRRQPWYVLVDPDRGRSVRVNEAAYGFVGRCDGTLTVQAIWDRLMSERGDAAPTQDELLGLLAQLNERGLLQFDRLPHLGPAGAAESPDRERRDGSANNPLSYRIRLGNPDRLLSAIARRTNPMIGSGLLMLWFGIVALAIVAAVVNWDVLRAHAGRWIDSPHYLLIAWAVYPAIKLVHELAHGLAVKKWGGSVPEFGITLLVLTPVPYVDASAASSFPRARQRFAVSVAGIVAELFVASLALFVWLNVGPGLLRDIAFVAMFVGAVSTLVVNGNPLLRFDGYYALCDALELPNLASRSRRLWHERLRSIVLRAPVERPLTPAPGERAWLVAYGPLAWLFRVFISIAIATWLGAVSFALGVIVGALLAWMLIGAPIVSLVRMLGGKSMPYAQRGRAARIAIGATLVSALLVSLVPLPFASVAQGVVWLPENARIRAQTDGFLKEVLARDGQRVAAGDVLFSLDAPELLVDRERLIDRSEVLRGELIQSIRRDPAKAADIDEELASTAAELARVEERVADLQVRAPAAGIVSIVREQDLPGRYVKRGTMLGHLLTEEPTTVRVALAQDQAAIVQHRTESVAIRLAEHPRRQLSGRLLRDAPATVNRLPSAALGDRGGGWIATDPQDREGLTPVAGVVLMDVALPGANDARLGARALVRFDHGTAPLARQLSRSAHQLFLQHFNPTD